MLLDWITLTYFKPFQSLPIIMFVSRERSTGKTSFLNLLKYIYGNNAVIGKNDLIMSNFNSLLAGKLIMDAGLKGYRVGNACVSEKHAGFVVNLGGASAADVRACRLCGRSERSF